MTQLSQVPHGAGAVPCAVAWWGNDGRNRNTTAALDAYRQANPTVQITTQPGEFASYWDKLATQTAGHTAPDIIQMDMAYISEYGERGALLDLAEYGVDTSTFAAGTVDAGKIDDKLVGVNAGINTGDHGQSGAGRQGRRGPPRRHRADLGVGHGDRGPRSRPGRAAGGTG